MKNLQGWMILGIACLASCVGTTIPVQAQQTATAIVVKERLVEHVGDRLIIDMKLALDELSLSANRSLVCTPLIERGDSVRALPPVIVNGRNRQIQYDRSGRDAAANGEFVLRRYNGKEQTFDYHASIPFAKWMERYAGACSRSFYVGEHVEPEDIRAKFENGILQISLPKAAKKQLPKSNVIAIE